MRSSFVGRSLLATCGHMRACSCSSIQRSVAPNSTRSRRAMALIHASPLARRSNLRSSRRACPVLPSRCDAPFPQSSRAAFAYGSGVRLAQQRIKLRPVQRHGFHGPGLCHRSKRRRRRHQRMATASGSGLPNRRHGNGVSPFIVSSWVFGETKALCLIADCTAGLVGYTHAQHQARFLVHSGMRRRMQFL